MTAGSAASTGRRREPTRGSAGSRRTAGGAETRTTEREREGTRPMKIGFIGLGIMGRPMAGHLQNAGHELFVVRHRSPPPEEITAGGPTECRSPRAVAARAEVIVLMVPDTPAV